jgi:hypothetical protein
MSPHVETAATTSQSTHVSVSELEDPTGHGGVQYGRDRV